MSLDDQMRRWSTRLRDDLKIPSNESNRLSATIQSEVGNLSAEVRKEMPQSAPEPLKERVEELAAFQSFMDTSQPLEGHPAIARARVILQNYICIVYLRDSCFDLLRKNVPSDSATRKHCKFLLDNPLRAFRNTLAHGNRRYAEDFSSFAFRAQ